MPTALLGLVVAAVLLGGIAAQFHHDVVRIYEARERLAAGATLVDVDAAGEFAQHHPRVAVNIPIHELSSRAHELGSLERPIVIYAHHWRDGAKAAHALRAAGFRDVFDAAGVRTKEQLSAAATRAAAARARFEEERGVPPEVELAPKTS